MEITDKASCIPMSRYLRPEQRSAREGADAESGQEPRVCGADTVALSDRVREIRSARQGIGAVPEIRQERVAELREQIREGRYEIDSGRIAEKMIEEALMFGVDAEP